MATHHWNFHDHESFVAPPPPADRRRSFVPEMHETPHLPQSERRSLSEEMPVTLGDKARRDSIHQDQIIAEEELPVPPAPETTRDLTEEDKEKLFDFDGWLMKQAELRSNTRTMRNTFRPCDILLTICGIVEMNYVYEGVSDVAKYEKIHSSLREVGVVEELENSKQFVELKTLNKSLMGYLGISKAKDKEEVGEEYEWRVQVNGVLRSELLAHFMKAYQKDQETGKIGLMKKDVLNRNVLNRSEKFDVNKHLDLDHTSYDGFTAAYCATVTCTHRAKKPTEIRKMGIFGSKVEKKYLEVNEVLSTLVMNNAKFINPADAKLPPGEKLFIYSFFFLIFGFAGLCFWLITTYSETHFNINYSCETVFGGLVLQPYGVIVANIIFFKVSESSVNKIVTFFSYLHYMYHHEEDTEVFIMAEENKIKDGGAALENIQKDRRNPQIVSSSAEATTPAPNEQSMRMSITHQNHQQSKQTREKAKEQAKNVGSRNLFAMHQYIAAWKQDNRYEGNDFLWQTVYVFLYLQLFYGFVSFILACISVSKLSHLSPWEQYTAFYGILTNSCIPMTFFQVFKMSVLDGRESQMNKIDFIFLVELFFFILLITPILTHVLPAMILYFWIVLFVAASTGALFMVLLLFLFSNVAVTTLWVKLYGLCFPSEGETSDVKIDDRTMEFLGKIAQEVLLRFFFIFYVQTLYHYACIVYTYPIPMSPQQYMHVIARDFALRSQTYCFYERAFNSGYGGILLFTSFI